MEKKYELVKGKCKDCAFSNKENRSCTEIAVHHKCVEVENKDKIWKDIKDEKNKRG